MTGEKKFTEQEYHRKMGVDLFNLVWSLLGKKDRTKEEDDKMIHAAHGFRVRKPWAQYCLCLHPERRNTTQTCSITSSTKSYCTAHTLPLL